MKKIYLGADHAGFELKEKLKEWMINRRIKFEDLGNTVYNPNDDYPDFAEKVARKVAQEGTFGILICGSAQGMCIAANKIKGIRAVVPISLKEVRLVRKHNDANILCLSGWFSNYYRSTKLIEKFLNTSFTKEKRHVRRLNKIKKMERK